MRMLSWNMAHRETHWHAITNDGNIDIALLQEAVPPPSGRVVETIPPERSLGNGGKPALLRCYRSAFGSRHASSNPDDAAGRRGRDELGVSLPGALAACEVILESGEQITVASIYGAWTSPIPWKASASKG